MAKTVARGALLEQPFIRDTNKTVNEVIKDTVAQLGENIRVRRFERCAAARLQADNRCGWQGLHRRTHTTSLLSAPSDWHNQVTLCTCLVCITHRASMSLCHGNVSCDW